MKQVRKSYYEVMCHAFLLDNDSEMLACRSVDALTLQCQSLAVCVEYDGTVETSLYLSFTVKILEFQN